MNKKQTISFGITRQILTFITLAVGICLTIVPFLLSNDAGAQGPPMRDDEVIDRDNANGNPSSNTCGGTETSIIRCSESGGDGTDITNSGIWGILKLTIQILTAGVGILAVAGIVWGAILYASAGGNSEQTKKAMNIIKNTVIGLLLYVFMFAIINFLVPGGVLR